MTTARVAYLFAMTFGTSGFSTNVTNIGVQGISRPALATSHMQTAQPGAGQLNNATFIPGKIIDGGGLQIEGHFDPNDAPPIAQTAETITITWPKADGSSVAGTWSGLGFMENYSVTGALDTVQTCSFMLKVAGAWTRTAES
jgi:hypothetical protein